MLLPETVTPSGTSAAPYTNGNRSQTNNFLLDGIDINEAVNDGVAFSPNLDALAEINVVTADGASEFGNASGSVINTVGNACSSDDSACIKAYTQSNGQTGGVPNDGTQWHTYGVEWTPSGVTWLIDGQVVYTAPASQTRSPAQQPATTMNMGLQSQNLNGGGTPTQRETMTVDWVEQYSWNG